MNRSTHDKQLAFLHEEVRDLVVAESTFLEVAVELAFTAHVADFDNVEHRSVPDGVISIVARKTLRDFFEPDRFHFNIPSSSFIPC